MTRRGATSAPPPNVLPFSKRPPPPEEYVLHSGEFEAIAVKPRDPALATSGSASAFARHAKTVPRAAFPQQPRETPAAHALPSSPSSFAPMAYGSDRRLAATGSHRSVGTVMIREKRPSLRWGAMIALTGALLGGALGLAMDARTRVHRAAKSVDVSRIASAVSVTSARAPAPVALVLGQTSRSWVDPVSHGSKATPSDSAGTAGAEPAALQAAAPAMPGKVAKPQAFARRSSAAIRPSSPVAPRVSASKLEATIKPERALKPDAQAKASIPEKHDASTKAAQDLLEQANKDTVNTL